VQAGRRFWNRDRAKQRWVQVRNEATGLHIGGGMGPVLVGGRNMSSRLQSDSPTTRVANSIEKHSELIFRATQKTKKPHHCGSGL
jgi:hypothetical protein